eukprot:COSAG02_NODE_14_length_56855_cov_512.793661_17_plen_103_part_00
MAEIMSIRLTPFVNVGQKYLFFSRPKGIHVAFAYVFVGTNEQPKYAWLILVGLCIRDGWWVSNAMYTTIMSFSPHMHTLTAINAHSGKLQKLATQLPRKRLL